LFATMVSSNIVSISIDDNLQNELEVRKYDENCISTI
jgi:hypothetical protein